MRPERDDGNAATRRAAWTLTAAAVAMIAAGCGGSSGSAKPAGSAGSGSGSSTIASSAGSSDSPPSSGTASASASTPASASVTGSSAAPGSPPVCAAPAVTARLDKLPGAAAGSTFWDIVATNHGPAACTLTARTAVTVLDSHHQQLPVTVNPDPAAKAMTLAPGASAAAVLAYASDDNPPCASKTSYLLVTPPGIELAFRDLPHCEHDVAALAGWVAGEHAAPR